jgi:RNA polymerase sigma-70 factor, ECF subfamily
MGVTPLPKGPAAGWAEFSDFYRADAARLAVFVVALGVDRDRAVELAHETMVALWRRWGELPGAPRTYARAVAIRRSARPRGADDVVEGPPPRFPALADDTEAVLAGLRRLPSRQRQVLAATLDDLPPEDVAVVLKIRTDAVGPVAEAARRALEGLLDGRPVGPAHAALIADVAAKTDVEAGLALVDATVPAGTAPLRAAPGSGSGAAERRSETDVPDELVAAAMAGDPAAVARLLEVIRPLVARYCRGRLGAVDRAFLSADDVAQEVCLAVLTALPNYRLQGRPFLAFVYGIAAHKVIDAHRAVTRGRSDPVAEVPDAIEVDAGPEQRALHGELSEQLRALLDELPDKQREILVLRIVVGLSAEETAEIVEATPGAVRVAQHRALGRLRKRVSSGLGPLES